MKPSLRLLIGIWALPLLALAQAQVLKTTETYALKQQTSLQIDLYKAADSDTIKSHPCIIFVFGGGFKEGTRDAEIYKPYFDHFAQKGFIVASIDYRLGLKGTTKAPSVFNQKPLINAIQLAVEDLYSATQYLIDNAQRLNIDTRKIIISGSSAGAITVLQAEYQKQNNAQAAQLPNNFNYAGVIAFAGAIYSTQGTPSYKTQPAPTLLFHGSNDKMVPYKQTRFFNRGMFGSKAIARKFKKEHYPYCFFSMEGIGHDAAEYPMIDYLPEIEHFINNFVFRQRKQYIDVNIRDDERKSTMLHSPKSYYK